MPRYKLPIFYLTSSSVNLSRFLCKVYAKRNGKATSIMNSVREIAEFIDEKFEP